jgi:hypothetical protein
LFATFASFPAWAPFTPFTLHSRRTLFAAFAPVAAFSERPGGPRKSLRPFRTGDHLDPAGAFFRRRSG